MSEVSWYFGYYLSHIFSEHTGIINVKPCTLIDTDLLQAIVDELASDRAICLDIMIAATSLYNHEGFAGVDVGHRSNASLLIGLINDLTGYTGLPGGDVIPHTVKQLAGIN